MEREPAPKFDENMLPAGAVETAADELADIDPAEFFDPEELGIRRSQHGNPLPASVKSEPNPYGCLWCKIPMTKDEMYKHHARHIAEKIERGNEPLKKRYPKAFQSSHEQ